ncbi:CHRD domain-containing protein [Novosphingobium sp. TH158]|uniref:CHRD domain-containing protein n=1 Tax=Novosphingobium sp. TH158 TaxID=2067455 RepID=UPI0013045704|nr:CHRD domain-containing protein [Novosphingobium sp. TH158]
MDRTKTRAAAALALAGMVLGPNPTLAAPVKLTATLSGANETAGGDPDGSGGFSVEIDAESNDFCYTLWTEKLGKFTAAHVHKGEAGSDGAPLVTLQVTGKDSDMCVAVDAAKLEPIIAKPEGWYVNVHTAEFPKGAVRGQLGK